MLKAKNKLFYIIILGLAFLLTPLTVYAAGTSLSKAFHYDGNVPPGSLVSVVSNKPNTVETSNQTNASDLIGVAIPNNQSLIEVNPSHGTLQVATEGSTYALVCDLNGDISVGDQITVSPFNGVGMRANTGSSVIGIAQSSFNAKSSLKSINVYTKSGRKQTIKVGYVKILILIGYAKSPSVVNGLQNLTEALVGKPISITRVIISFIIAVLGLVSIITIVYASIDGTIISIGRNPLAKNNVFRILRSVSYFSVIILVLCVVAIYLLLQ